ncbi:MAG: ParB/RepB/Spo0J family partition protein [Candidatus Buchananbacteria bacterium]|nr:ParB/RepB/Spo0J family partition protein [Candidatus Buchananbacteria bacterium]
MSQEVIGGEQMLSGYQLWPIKKVKPNPDQPRQTNIKDPSYREDMEALKDSIEAIGQLIPILVSQPDKKGCVKIIDGERRWTALNELNSEKRIADNLGTIKIIFEIVDDENELECFLLSFGANCCRLDMPPIDIAKAIRKLQKVGYTVDQIARITGKSIHWVYNMLKYLKLDETMMAKLNEGEINPQIAMALASFKPEFQPQVLTDLQKVIDKKGRALTQAELSLSIAQIAKNRKIKPSRSKKGKAQQPFEVLVMRRAGNSAKNLNELLVKIADLAVEEIDNSGGQNIITLDQELAKLQKLLKQIRAKLDRVM